MEGAILHGLIFDIKRFSIHDGPGIRTTVFFKGCPLSCRWCQNPESISPLPQEMFRESRCIGCGRCSEGCYSGARETVGREISVEELVGEVVRDREFYRESEGGVTFSGGEPLMQCDFLIEALEACGSQGLHRVCDTSGLASRECIAAAAELTDLFLFDVKHVDSQIHLEFTGTGCEVILGNLEALLGMGKAVHVRVPVVAGFNDDERSAELIAAYLSRLRPAPPVELLRCHSHAAAKYSGLGMPVTDYVPALERVKAFARRLDAAGLRLTGGCR